MTREAQGRSAQVSVRFALALNRIQARIKQETEKTCSGLTPSQVAMLERLKREGSMSVTELAAAEHVSQQAITQRLALLQPTGYVEQRRHPSDARKKLVTLSSAGENALAQLSRAQKTWLAEAIAQDLDPADLEVLDRAAELMEQLASSDAQ